MIMESILFVGGPEDGKYYLIHSEVETVYFPQDQCDEATNGDKLPTIDVIKYRRNGDVMILE